jgi:hypothetical protein
MNGTVRMLIIVSALMLILGGSSYYYGQRLNLAIEREAGPALVSETVQVSEGDKFVFSGGALMLVAGALALGVAKFWVQEKRKKEANAIGSAGY